MRCLVVGFGTQGKKRLAHAPEDVVAIVDPVSAEARYRAITDAPTSEYDAAFVCTPDDVKHGILRHCLAHGKHVLVEKPLILRNEEFAELSVLARGTGAACYTAY